MYGLYGLVQDSKPRTDPDAIPKTGVVHVEWSEGVPMTNGPYQIRHTFPRDKRRIVVPWNPVSHKAYGTPATVEPSAFFSVKRIK